MKTVLRITLLFSFVAGIVFSQKGSLFLPKNFQRAYQKQTRSYDGKPGINYWQNKCDYKIKAKFEPVSRKLSGEETITFYNNSTDTLKQIVLRLYPDIYRKGNVRDFEIEPQAITEGMKIEKLSVGSSEINMDDKKSAYRQITNLFVQLEQRMSPKSRIEIKVVWNFMVPNKSQVRMGGYDSTSFFIAYWYPQVAVYDDIDGWDEQNYTGMTEMYNDFNNYQVELTVPKGFLLWSTGVLQNPKEVYSKNIFEKFQKALQSDKIVNVVEKKDYETGLVTADKEKLIYKIDAHYVPDFAFAVSDHYLWDASNLVVDKQTGRSSFISAAYNKSTEYFSNVAEIARKSIEGFSTYMPAVPYPYPTMTVFNGQGGMEFPMMCNNTAVKELWGTVHLTSHEICHTYFPFHMGINERKYAWMDEGWATMLPFDFQTENASGYDPRSRNAQGYSDFAGHDSDIPLMIPSYNLKNPAYRTASYRRPGVAYEFLRQMLGDEIFKKALNEYINRWNGKHPVPYDFFFTFDNVIGEDLSWYWKPWFFETKHPDLSIEKIKDENSDVECAVKNIGGLPVPVIIKVSFDDGTNEVLFNQSAKIWKDGVKEVKVKLTPNKKITKVELGTTQIPDTDISNNQLIIEQ